MAGAMSGGTHLTLDERERLVALKAEGLGLRAIAARLGRAASTVSRELRRNALPKGGYPGFTHEGLWSYAQTGAGETVACKASVLSVDAQAGRADFRLELGADGSHA